MTNRHPHWQHGKVGGNWGDWNSVYQRGIEVTNSVYQRGIEVLLGGGGTEKGN